MILCVETSWESGSLALPDKDGRLHSLHWEKRSSHSEVITQEFQNLMSTAQAGLKGLSKIAVDVGPGSFTGVRVGLSFATSLAYRLNIPLIAVNSLELMAFKSDLEGRILITLPAIKGHFYVSGFEKTRDRLSEVLTPQSMSQDEISALSSKYPQLVDGKLRENRPDAETVSRFLGLKARSFKELSWNLIKPLYLRRSEAEEKLSRGLLKPVYKKSEQQIERNRKQQSD